MRWTSCAALRRSDYSCFKRNARKIVEYLVTGYQIKRKEYVDLFVELLIVVNVNTCICKNKWISTSEIKKYPRGNDVYYLHATN